MIDARFLAVELMEVEVVDRALMIWFSPKCSQSSLRLKEKR
jgi:hypothetical protein